MYKIYADKTLIYDSTLEDYAITKGTITKEVNKSGSFVFTIYKDHPYYNLIERLKTIITVYKRDSLIFRGRVISDKIGFQNDKTYTCEGELSFLVDSIQRPYTFTGSPKDLLIKFIESHNSQVESEKQFQIGDITVEDPNDYINRSNTSYEDTLTNINNRLIKTLNGYLHVTRDAENVPYLNYFADYPYESHQTIEFGENLLNFTKTNTGEDIATAIIPLGKKTGEGEEAKPLTIESVNDGLDYIYDEKGVEKYGWIFKVVTWDDVTLPENLLQKARAYLVESINQNITIELTAIDLSLMDKSIDDFQMGDYIRITSEPHNMDDKLLLKKQTIDLLKPDNNKITLGYTYSSFTDTTVSALGQSSSIVQKVEYIENNYAVNTIMQSEMETLRSLIEQTSESITTEVLGEFVSNDVLQSQLSTLFTQLNDSFEFMFQTLSSTVDEHDIEAREQYNEIMKYIRFIDGNIILGESGNELILKIQNNRISFLDNDVEVAYLSNNKLYVTDAEILKSLQIGNFAYLPRDNGNLSFKKVR